DFTGAWKLCQQAIELAPIEDHPVLGKFGDDPRFAGADRPGLLTDLRERIAEDPLDTYTVEDTIRLLHVMDDPAEAWRVGRAYLDALEQDEFTEQETLDYWNNRIAAVHAVAAHNVDAYARVAEREPDDVLMAVDAALAQGRWADAADQLREGDLGFGSRHMWLLVYAGAARSGDTELADTARAEAAVWFNQSNSTDRELATWLEGADIPSDASSRLHGDPNDLAIVHTALAALDPDREIKFISMARRMNFKPGPGYLAVRRICNPT
ncbi:MAG: hypothetical protein AAF078_07080, partial [Planctomycetota bacterium]